MLRWMFSPAERDKFLKQVCGNDLGLRREVESLLSFEEKAKNFIELPPRDLATDFFCQSDRRSKIYRYNSEQLSDSVTFGSWGNGRGLSGQKTINLSERSPSK